MLMDFSQTDERQQMSITLPSPRIWKPKDLADFLGFSVHWVYKQTKAGADDPPPRCKGLSRIRFDSGDPLFQAWLSRQLEPR